MIISNEEEWRKYQLYNTHQYGQTILSFAQRWANRIEGRLEFENGTYKSKKDIKEIIKTDITFEYPDNITKRQKLIALIALTKFWKYGPELAEALDIDSEQESESDNLFNSNYTFP